VSDNLARGLGLAGLGLGAYAVHESRKKRKNYVLAYYNSSRFGGTDMRSSIFVLDAQEEDIMFLTIYQLHRIEEEIANIYYSTRDMEKLKGNSLVDWWDMSILTDLNDKTYFTLPDLNDEVIAWELTLDDVKPVFLYWSWSRKEDYTGAYPILQYSTDGSTWIDIFISETSILLAKYFRVRIPATPDWPAVHDNVFIRELNVIIPTEISPTEYDEITDTYIYDVKKTYSKSYREVLGVAGYKKGVYMTLNAVIGVYRELSKMKRAPSIYGVQSPSPR